jgi:hypothetical protein
MASRNLEMRTRFRFPSLLHISARCAIILFLLSFSSIRLQAQTKDTAALQSMIERRIVQEQGVNYRPGSFDIQTVRKSEYKKDAIEVCGSALVKNLFGISMIRRIRVEADISSGFIVITRYSIEDDYSFNRCR